MPDGRDKYREVRTARQFEDQINTEKCMATCALLIRRITPQIALDEC
jgi:hypothetical protein